MSIARVTAFNNLLRDIVKTAGKHFSDDKELEYTKSQIELAISVSPRTTITTFVQSTQPYLEKILNKDDAYFRSMAEETSALKGLNINEKWDSLDSTEREHIWKNIQKMVVLGNKILSE